eukprot:3577663-Pyramimonas_sp.AAC.1
MGNSKRLAGPSAPGLPPRPPQGPQCTPRAPEDPHQGGRLQMAPKKSLASKTAKMAQHGLQAGP